MPKCKSCKYVKSHIQSTKGSTPIIKPDTGFDIKTSYTRPGDRVSVDHFESCLKGHNLTSFIHSSSEQSIGG